MRGPQARQRTRAWTAEWQGESRPSTWLESLLTSTHSKPAPGQPAAFTSYFRASSDSATNLVPWTVTTERTPSLCSPLGGESASWVSLALQPQVGPGPDVHVTPPQGTDARSSRCQHLTSLVVSVSRLISCRVNFFIYFSLFIKCKKNCAA